MKHYITRNGGATVTIFVPYDCQNKCPFCINKAEYADTSCFNIYKIIQSIVIMDTITPTCDFVFTGGEPLANLQMLQIMLDAIPNTHKVFINTTLPTNQPMDALVEFLNTNYREKKITGINVSRHLKKYVQEHDDKIFELLDFEPRINCVLYEKDLTHYALNDLAKNLKTFVSRFVSVTSHIQFRKDYVITTPENLYDEENDKILNLLKYTFKYIGPFDQYRMRCGYEFLDIDNNYRITYHKTLPYSKISTKDDSTFILYDIIIKQDGRINEDWDTCSSPTVRVCDVLAEELDLDAYKNVIFEDYK